MNWNTISIEILTGSLALLLLLVGFLLPAGKKAFTGYLSALALAGLGIYTVLKFPQNLETFFNGFYQTDALAWFFKLLFIAAALLITLLSIRYTARFEDEGHEYYSLLVFTLLGMMVMVSANDLITLYLGLELMTLTFVILTAFDRKKVQSGEAGLKYILLSALSSAVLLYGLSILYGFAGSVLYKDIFGFLTVSKQEPILIMAGLMLIAGFAFKISAVPFHMWSPDVYEGAPTPITAFLSVGSKAAAFAVIIRVFFEIIPQNYSIFIILIISLSVLSMVIGNIIALPQKNIKRLLAYSSIAHAGYILLGLIPASANGLSAVLYYILLYLFANLGAFAVVITYTNITGNDDIDSFTGLWQRSPFLTSVLIISLLSLAGIPPAAGFIGKFYLFAEIIRKGYLWLALLAIGMSVVSIYYYIVVIRVAILGKAEDTSRIKIPLPLMIVLVITAFMTLFMGLYPGPITNWTTSIIAALVH